MMLAKWNQAVRQFLDNPEFRESRRIRLIIYVALSLAMYLILVDSFLPTRYQFAIGQTSPVTIVAPVSAVDTQATDAARRDAMAKVPRQYVQSQAVEEDALGKLDTLFSTATQTVADKTLTPTQKLDSLVAVAPRGVTRKSLQTLLTVRPQQIGILQSIADRIVRNLLDGPFYQESVQEAPLLVDKQMLDFTLDHASQSAVQNVVESVLLPNMIYQDAQTRAARESAARSVPDVMIHQGQVIVEQNGIITSTVQGQLQDIGLDGRQPNYAMAAGFALFILITMALLAAYVERREQRRRIDNLMLLIVGLILILMAVFISVTKTVINIGASPTLAYLVPISVGSMLITVLMDSSLAVVASFYVSFLFGGALDFDYAFAFVGFVGALVGSYSLARVTHRGAFMRAGFLVSAMNVVSITAMRLMQHSGTDWHTFVLQLGFGMLNGVVSAVLTMGILPFFESAFGLLTAIHLLELSNPDNPLLKKLLMEAPGTYHHSLIVGNLAEAAAEIVGANPLLCRVGAYYHDVGKTRRPAFFVENQMTRDNPHDKIAPSLSHLIITSHVSDGLEMLRKAGLPKPIRDVCATHHGTTILWYFYNKAKELDKNGTVHVDDYRYAGPKPKTRECAIVMVCDAVEASVRSMSKPTPNRIEGVIRKIIRERLEDGQLDQCDLTLQDLDVMIGAFMKILQGIYHTRIEYPDPDKIRKEVTK